MHLDRLIAYTCRPSRRLFSFLGIAFKSSCDGWQQPVEIFQRLVKDFSNVGDLVVDPCGGSFTTAIACAQPESRRRFIGCDIDEHSVRIGQQRLDEEASQLDAPIRSGKRLRKLGVRIYDDPEPMPFNCSVKRRAVEENRFQGVIA